MRAGRPTGLNPLQTEIDARGQAWLADWLASLLERGDRGRKVRRLQRKMNRVFPAYSDLRVDGIFGKSTEDVIQKFQRRSGLTADGIIGAKTRRALARSGVKI